MFHNAQRRFHAIDEQQDDIETALPAARRNIGTATAIRRCERRQNSAFFSAFQSFWRSEARNPEDSCTLVPEDKRALQQSYSILSELQIHEEHNEDRELSIHCGNYPCYLMPEGSAFDEENALANSGYYFFRAEVGGIAQIHLAIVHLDAAVSNEMFTNLDRYHPPQDSVLPLFVSLKNSEHWPQSSQPAKEIMLDPVLKQWFVLLSVRNKTQVLFQDIFWDETTTAAFIKFLSHEVAKPQTVNSRVHDSMVDEKDKWASGVTLFSNIVAYPYHWGNPPKTYRFNTAIRQASDGQRDIRHFPTIFGAIATQFTHQHLEKISQHTIENVQTGVRRLNP